ncbi:MAG: hypothetical protein ICV84_09915 [Flavisolibacter sp.]|nr:hypothetical protein [Flavisolibacter sp.]
MRARHCLFLLLMIAATVAVSAKPVIYDSIPSYIKRVDFFKDDKPVNLVLNTDFKKLRAERKKGIYQNAKVTMQIPGYAAVTENVRLFARGEYRRTNCYMPAIMINFKNDSARVLSGLKKVKLVCGCGTTASDEQLILTEYLVYKMYNLLTDMSFRVRLAKVRYEDASGKLKPYTQYGFLIEDVDQMAKRSECIEVQKRMYLTEQTNRYQMTMVALFQYMIGNTDWAVPNYHNIKLMRPKRDSLAMPYVVPYDFDYAGFVNAEYAIPAPELGIEKVTDRMYRGFPRTLEELQSVLQVFQNKKDSVMSLIKNFDLVRQKDRDIMARYIADFYSIIADKRSVQYHFIDNARRN